MTDRQLADYPKVKTASRIKPGMVLEWDEITDPVRGDHKRQRITVKKRAGMNIQREDGDWLWWPTIKRHGVYITK